MKHFISCRQFIDVFLVGDKTDETHSSAQEVASPGNASRHLLERVSGYPIFPR